MIQPNNYRIDEAKYKSLLKYIRLSVTEKYEFPQEIVQIDGVTIATIGNFSASTGKHYQLHRSLNFFATILQLKNVKTA